MAIVLTAKKKKLTMTEYVKKKNAEYDQAIAHRKKFNPQEHKSQSKPHTKQSFSESHDLHENKKDVFMKYSDIMKKEKWFVVHESELFDKNPCLIGFRDPSEWRVIKKDHIVFYYRTSPYTRIMGIYSVVRSEEDIDKNFFITNKDGKREYLHHQHEIILVYPFECHFGTDQHERLSFHHTLHNPKRFDNKQVFKLTRGDAEFILKQQK
jgi:hypothetical protein